MISLPAKQYAIVSAILVSLAAACGALLDNEGLQGKAKLAVMVLSVVAATLMKSVAPDASKS